VEERRQYPRYAATWPVRFWVDEARVITGHAVDASVRGMSIDLDEFPGESLKLGDEHRVEMILDSGDTLACIAAIRRVKPPNNLGLEVVEELPGPPPEAGGAPTGA